MHETVPLQQLIEQLLHTEHALDPAVTHKQDQMLQVLMESINKLAQDMDNVEVASSLQMHDGTPSETTSYTVTPHGPRLLVVEYWQEEQDLRTAVTCSITCADLCEDELLDEGYQTHQSTIAQTAQALCRTCGSLIPAPV